MTTGTMQVRDGGGFGQNLAVENNGGVFTPHSAPEIAGAAVSAGNPMPVKLTDGTTAVVVSPQGSLAVAGLAAVGTAPTSPPLSVSGVDGGGLKRHILTDASGIQQVAIPAGVLQAGSTGTDYSANAMAVSGTPLLTIPATPTRAFVEVQNQSAAALQLVRDDGAGNNQTSILLAPGAAAGQQGGGWSSSTFKGRLRVYGAGGSQVAAYQD